jgi:hypothetical protein
VRFAAADFSRECTRKAGDHLQDIPVPAEHDPRIDGNDDDWAMVPDSYAIGMDQLEDTEAPGGHGTNRDRKDLDVKVKVGWVKGLNRLYFLYEAYKGYWTSRAPICITTSSRWLWMATFPAVR